MPKKTIPEIVVQVSPRRFAVCGAPTVVNGVAYYEPVDDGRFTTLLDGVAAARARALRREGGVVQTAAPDPPPDPREQF